jgi:phage terminase Nu1 subunit (DNA packaging protein)
VLPSPLEMKRRFPRLNQTEMATFLGIKRERLKWATSEGIVERDDGGQYHPEVATSQWLNYERSQIARRAGESEFERQRARLTRAKAETVERHLAVLDGSLMATNEIVQTVKTVCLRIKSKLHAALPRLTRTCFHAPSLTEALKKSRGEFDLLIAELTALDDAGTKQFEVVKDANGDSERSTAAKSQRKRAS